MVLVRYALGFVLINSVHCKSDRKERDAMSQRVGRDSSGLISIGRRTDECKCYGIYSIKQPGVEGATPYMRTVFHAYMYSECRVMPI